MKKLILSLTILLVSFNSYAGSIEKGIDRESKVTLGVLKHSMLYKNCLEGKVIYFTDRTKSSLLMYKKDADGNLINCSVENHTLIEY